MVLPVGAMISGGGMLLDAIMGSDAQEQQNNIAIMNYYMQRNAQRQNVKFAKADKTDAYGNVVGYEEGKGFVTKLTPLQRAIMSAQQGEQLSTLKKDAPRQRAAAERQDARSQTADKAFNEVMGEYNIRNRPTERGEQGKSVLRALEERKGQGGSDGFLNQAIRTGVTPKSGNSGQTLAAAIMDAKEKGSCDWLNKDQALSGKSLNEANSLRGIADGTTSNPIDTQTNQAGALGQSAEGSMAALMQAIQQGAAAQGQALGGIKYEHKPVFGQLGQLAAGEINSGRDRKMLQEQNAFKNKESDRDYALKYYMATGRFPS